MSLQNLKTVGKFSIFNHYLCSLDPFADDGEQNQADLLVHIRIQQRNGRKTLTTVQGLSDKYDKKLILKACKKEFACNGNVVQHEQYGEVLQLQGDQRENIASFLKKFNLAKNEQIKIHGFWNWKVSAGSDHLYFMTCSMLYPPTHAIQ